MTKADALRNAADVLDLGTTEKLRTRLRAGRLVQVTPASRHGKAVYQLR